jgi:formimidoylglutamate deiminase
MAMNMGFAIHSLRAVDAATVRELAAYPLLPAHAPIHIHAAEQTKEVEDCRAALGKPPIAWLIDNVALNDRWTIIHAIHMTKQESSNLSRTGATVAICPTAEANLGDGIFPLAHFLAAGGRIAIGSDAHMSVTPIDELRLLETGQRLAERRRLVATSERETHTGARLWRSCAESGARVTGQKIGTIAKGQRADLIALDPGDPMLSGRADDFLLDSLIFAADKNAVSDVFVAGRHVVKAGHHPHAERARAAFISAVAGLFAS